MVVYITTNLINGKKYIGKDEANRPGYLGSGKAFVNALKKYGTKNFEKEILAYTDSSEDLEWLEKYYISYYGAQKSKLFYNIAPGGTGGTLCLDYAYRERPIYEIDSNTYEVIGEYKSSREAGEETGLNWKQINAVCAEQKRYVNKRVFAYKDTFNSNYYKINRLVDYCRNIYCSYKTGVFYFNLKELYEAEFSHFISFSSFNNYIFKHKEYFLDKFLTEKIGK